MPVRRSSCPRTRQPPPSGIRPSFLTSTWMSSPVARSRRDNRDKPCRAKIACTVDGAMFRHPASRCGPQRHDRRSRQTRASTSAGAFGGIECGRLDRSCRPARPSVRHRFNHFDAVARETPDIAARALLASGRVRCVGPAEVFQPGSVWL